MINISETNFRNISISGFGSHIAISRYRSLSQWPGNTFIYLTMESSSLHLEFRWYLPYISRYKYFRFWRSRCYFRLSILSKSLSLVDFSRFVVREKHTYPFSN